MKRKFIVLRKSTQYNRAFCVDIEEANVIVELLTSNRKNKEKLDYIIHRILEFPNMYFGDYKKLKQYGNIRITEIRLFPNGANSRIYCSEISTHSGTLFIIMALFVQKKKDMFISKKLKTLIEKINKYEYECQE